MAPNRLRLRNVFSDLVVGAQPSLSSARPTAGLPLQSLTGCWSSALGAPLLPLAVALVALPVFVQAPWVHAHPWGAALATVPLLSLGLVLGLSERPNQQQLGALLVGFAGSWLGGSLFWGWFRLHPFWHLPLESIALPLALGGLRSRWRLAGAFYLASLLGTAATDAAMALSGVMAHWPLVLAADGTSALLLLQDAAEAALEPTGLAVVSAFAIGLIAVSSWLWRRGGVARLSAAVLITTLMVDGVFWGLSLAAPRWSGLL